MIHTCLQRKAQPTGGTPVTSEAAQFNPDIIAGLHPVSHPSPAAGTIRAWHQSKLLGFQGLQRLNRIQ